MLADAFQRRESVRLVKVNDRIELFREMRFEIMGIPFSIWTINNADGALKHRVFQAARQISIWTNVQKKIIQPGLVEKIFKAVRQTGTHPFDFRWRIPIVGGHYRPGVSRETDVPTISIVPFAHQLTEIELTAFGHLRCARIA